MDRKAHSPPTRDRGAQLGGERCLDHVGDNFHKDELSSSRMQLASERLCHQGAAHFRADHFAEGAVLANARRTHFLDEAALVHAPRKLRGWECCACAARLLICGKPLSARASNIGPPRMKPLQRGPTNMPARPTQFSGLPDGVARWKVRSFPMQFRLFRVAAQTQQSPRASVVTP